MDSRPRPEIIDGPKQLCVYINLYDEKKPKSESPKKSDTQVKSESSSKSKSSLKVGPEFWTYSERSNIRAKLTKKMCDQGWLCQNHTMSFIFCKHMALDDKESDPVEKAHKEISFAIEETTKTYEGAQFQYVIMRPVKLVGVTDLAKMFKAGQTVEELQNKTHEEGIKTEIKEEEIVEEGSPLSDLNDMKNNLPSTSS